MASKPKLLITSPLLEQVITLAEDRFETETWRDHRAMGRAELVARAQNKDALLVTLAEKMTAEVIDQLPASVRVIATYSVGFDHIDVAAAKARGITVTNTPDAVTIATAEIAMLLILSAARRSCEGEQLLRQRYWIGWHPTQLLGRRLDGKRLGIFGMGQIGQALAKRARAFDMQIHYHNRHRLPEELELGAVYHDSLESLASVSDVFSVNAPLTAATRGIVNAALLAKLPPGAIVVNSARGPLVNDDDLIAALKSGQVGYAGLDVFNNEPDIDERYFDLENAFLLPHMGTSVIEARIEMGVAALENIAAVLEGHPPLNPVD